MAICASAIDCSIAKASQPGSKALRVRPFLKWAGNKFRVLDHIHPLLPSGNKLIEPFAGSGALFLNSDYNHYLLTDSNADLINLYTILKEQGPTFIRDCKRYFSNRYNQQEQYYRLRSRFNHSEDSYLKSILFVYLNRHGYNGLCRYNAKGGYNVPFGRYVRPYFPEKEMLYFHDKAQHAVFKINSFEKTFQLASKGDVIYCDPPYVPLSPSANFTSYAAGGFSQAQQELLASLSETAARNGVPVLLSNHNTPFTRKTYQGATKIKKFHVQRYISCNGNKRNNAGELLALFK